MPSVRQARRARSAPATLASLAALACAGLTACGGSGVPPEVVVTVTQSPSASKPGSASPSQASPTKKATATSEVRGRDFDFGFVTAAKKVGDTDVLVLDRWTDPNVPDEKLADDGLEAAPWDLGSDRYVNQNDKVTFDIPVREGTSFLLHHCVAKGEPLQTRSVGASELAGAPEADRLVLVEIDDDGWATGGETFAGC
jgi:hypothetical protein